MKTKRFFLLWMFLLSMIVLPAKAMSLGDIRINARFLTDRMAFELNLMPSQYDALYEINYDFLSGVDRYMDDLVYADPYAVDAYYRYLDERNDDLRWILSLSDYKRFMALDYFYRPLYLSGNRCELRIYSVYPNRTVYYYDRPVHYYTYNGAHSRRYYKNYGYYRSRFNRGRGHKTYMGTYRIAADYRRSDFGNYDRRDNDRGYRIGKDVRRDNDRGYRIDSNVRRNEVRDDRRADRIRVEDRRQDVRSNNGRGHAYGRERNRVESRNDTYSRSRSRADDSRENGRGNDERGERGNSGARRR